MVNRPSTGAASAAGSRKRRKSHEQVAAVTLRDGTVKWRSWLPLGRSGKRKWTPLFATKLEALQCREEMLSIDGELPRETLTLGDAVTAAQVQLGATRRPGTAMWFKDHSASLLRDLGKDRLLASIKPADIERLVQKSLADGLSPQTIKHRRAALSRIFATSKRHLLRNPLKAVDPGIWPDVRRKERYSFTPGEVAAITDAIRECDHPDAARDADLLSLLFLSGLRRAELCRLTVRSVDLDRRLLWVDGKRGNESMPLGIEAVEVLRRLVAVAVERDKGADAPTGLIVPGGVSHLRYICNRWSKHLANDARFRSMIVEQGRRLTPHTLRHSFCTALAEARVDVEVARRLMRHQSLAVTMIYMHAKSEALTGALDSLSLQAKPKGNARIRRA